jgi:hypothetical protein
LKAVSLGPLHGYGILLRIEQISPGHCRLLHPRAPRDAHRPHLLTAWRYSLQYGQR